MVVIEGSDLTGKTTLAKKLVSLGTPYGPLVYRRLGLLPGNFNYYDDYVNRMSHLVVQDRFYLSEYVYGNICRGGSPLTLDGIRRLADDFVAVGGLHVILTADEKVLRERYAENKKREIFTIDQILQVNDKFTQLAQGMPIIHSQCVHYHSLTRDDFISDEKHPQNFFVRGTHNNLLRHIYGTCD